MRKCKNSKHEKHKYREDNLQEVEKKVESTMHEIESACTLIENQLNQFKRLGKNETKTFGHFTEVWLKWLDYEIRKYEEDRFAGIQEPGLSLNYLHNSRTIEEFWTSANVYARCKYMKWNIRFTMKAKNKVTVWGYQQRVNLLKKLSELSVGYIKPEDNCKVISEGPCAHMVFFSTAIKGTDQILIFAVLLDRLPVIRSNRLAQFKFAHYLKVIDILKKGKHLQTAVDHFKNSIKNDPDRWIEPIRDYEGWTIYPSYSNSVAYENEYCVVPHDIAPISLNLKEANSFQFNQDTNRWVSLTVHEKESQEIPLHEQNIINKLANSASGYEFIRFLRRIPNFRIKLTEEQETLVRSPGNVLAIGRSGTGKTTCSILRLLTTELLFRYTLRDKSKQFSPEDIDRSTVLHTVFVTASPVLTNEVKNFYKKIGEHIKQELREKEEKLRKNVEIVDEDEEKTVEGQHNEENFEIKDNEEESESEEEVFSGLTSLEFLSDEDFPLFVTVRKIIFMVDASMKRPFFTRNKEGQIIGSNNKFQWHNELKGALMINKEYKLSKQTEDIGVVEAESSDSDSDYEIESARKPENKKRSNAQSTRQSYRKLSYEVDFHIFSTKFYPRIRSKCKYSPLLLWTEISAYIKGSSQAYKYTGYYLPSNVYITMGRKSSMLSAEAKYEIWYFFIEYERWKNKEDAYDMQDVVNYLLNQITFYGFQGVPIHYMMVDEVQDLTPATLNLLLQITKKQLFFSGDTAQTIAKGVGFRFLDLKSLFNESKLETPTICQLTMNFRTHNQILGLANSVVAVLETLFPLTIDKMAKEVSPKDGPMPCVLLSKDVQDLIYTVFGTLNSADTQSTTNEFGCNQVIIVRNQESKDKLPEMLKHALCLTVFESKGLEFDDVILYNFFTDSDAPANMWALFRSLHQKQNCDSNRPTRFEDLEQSVPKLETRLEANNPNYSILCTELKHLYVAVTRPKKRLVIFDEDQNNRKAVEEFWHHMGVANFTNVSKSGDGEIVIEGFDGKFAQKTTKEEWKKQGIKMFGNKYYEQAQKCFEIAGEVYLAARAEAYTLANKAAFIFAEIDSAETELGMSKQKTRASKKEIKMKKALACNMFVQAGDKFMCVASDSSISDNKRILKEAARCFSSGQAHKKAAEIFKSIQLFGQAGEAEFACGNFEQAGDLFCVRDEYARAIEAYKIGMNWDKLVKTIYKYKEQMNDEERHKYIQKYVPAAFEDLTPKLMPGTDTETNYIKKIRLETENVILEDSDESSDEEKEAESGKAAVSEGKTQKTEEKSEEEAKKTEGLLENIQQKPEINPQDKEVKDLNQLSDVCDLVKSEQASSDSFILMNSESSFSLLSEGLDNIDPDDEWLQLESGSVVDSLDSIINPDGSIASDFSLLSNNNVLLRGKLIKTRGDIFIEDTTMRKIIEYVSMFSDEVSTYLKNLRSSPSLVSSQVFKHDWELVSLIDLDELSPEMLGLLLDMLEEFGMNKLSLIVCNRYNLIERIGRFIVSMAFKYSNLSSLTYAGYKLNVKEQVQRAAIGFTALHNVFEMMNPDYLCSDKGCQLGLEVFQGLILLGYWKKVVFLLDKPNGLAVSWMFNDLNSYIRILGGNPDEFKKLEWLPSDFEIENFQDLIAGLDFSRQNSIINKPSNHYKINLSLSKALRTGKGLNKLIDSLSSTISNYFSSAKSHNNKQLLHILESVNAWSVLMLELKSQKLHEKLVKLPFNLFEKVLHTSNYLLKYLTNGRTPGQAIPYLRHCILSPAGVRSIPLSKISIIFPVHSHSILHVSSPLFQGTLKVNAFAVDLEGQSYLAENSAINTVFINHILTPLLHIIEERRRNASCLQNKLNSLGEIWLAEFILAKSCYSIKTFDYFSQISPIKYNEYLRVKDQLAELKGEDAGDDKYNDFMTVKNKRKIEKLQNLVKVYEKDMKSVMSCERLNYINSVLEECKYPQSEPVKISASTRQALLTYAQVMMNSSEREENSEVKYTKMWMAYELCNISDRLICFIEMLRCRHRPVLVKGKKFSKLSLAYNHALGFADISVYCKHDCLDSASESILNILETIDLPNDLIIYFLERSVVYWVLSYTTSVTLPQSLMKHWSPSRETATENKGKLRIKVFEKVVHYFLHYSIMPVSDELKHEYLTKLANCLGVILTYIQKDRLAEDCLMELQKKPGFNVGRSLIFKHKFFSMIREYPSIKTVIKGRTVKVNHKPFPEQELEKDWVVESKTVASHQRCANILIKCCKSKPKPKFSLLSHMYSVNTGKTLNESTQQLLESCSKYMSGLFTSFYRIILFKSLDLHYILDQILTVSKYIEEIETCPTTIESINNNVRRFENWKIMVKPAGTEQKLKAKKKWNVKWRNRAKRIYMKSVRLLNFGVEYPQLEKDSSIFRSGKKRFGEFKNKISISMLNSIPVYELEKTLVNDLRESRRFLRQHRTRKQNYSEIESGGGKPGQVFHSPLNGSYYFNENLKDVYPKGRYASVGRDLRMANYGMSILK